MPEIPENHNSCLLVKMADDLPSSSVANFIIAYEEAQQNRNSHFLFSMCSVFPKATI